MVPPSVGSISPPPFGSSPIARPSGNPGNAAQAASLVQQAVDMLEKALPDLPPGHDLHKAVTGAISSLAKHAPPAEAAPGVGLTGLKQMLAQKLQQSPLAALMAGRGGGAPGGAPPMGGGMPPMPPPMGGGGAAAMMPGGAA